MRQFVLIGALVCASAAYGQVASERRTCICKSRVWKLQLACTVDYNWQLLDRVILGQPPGTVSYSQRQHRIARGDDPPD